MLHNWANGFFPFAFFIALSVMQYFWKTILYLKLCVVFFLDKSEISVYT